jgi:hypothetical protein
MDISVHCCIISIHWETIVGVQEYIHMSGFLSIGHFGKHTSVQALGSWCGLISLWHINTAAPKQDAGDGAMFL